MARSVPYEKNAVISREHRGVLEAPHGFVKPLAKFEPAGGMDVSSLGSGDDLPFILCVHARLAAQLL